MNMVHLCQGNASDCGSYYDMAALSFRQEIFHSNRSQESQIFLRSTCGSFRVTKVGSKALGL